MFIEIVKLIYVHKFEEAARVLKDRRRIVITGMHPNWALSGHNYAGFFDENGQEYRIPEYPHLIGEYCRLFKKFGIRLEEIREPGIEDWLIIKMPILKEYKGLPLAMIIKARKEL